jgi:hypothetical protein
LHCRTPAADAHGNGFLGAGTRLPDTLERRLDGMCGLERFDLFGKLGSGVGAAASPSSSVS